MDVRSIEQVPASPEHQGTVPVWWLFKPREMREETLGGHLELVSEFEVMGGGEVHPHSIRPSSSTTCSPAAAS